MAGWAVSLALRGAGLATGPADAPAPVPPPHRDPSAEAGPPAEGPREIADLDEPATPAPHPDEPPEPVGQPEPARPVLPDQGVPGSGPRDRRAGTDLPRSRAEQAGGEAEPAARRRPADVGPPEPAADLPVPSPVPLPSQASLPLPAPFPLPAPYPSPVPASPPFRNLARPEGEAVHQPDAISPPGAAAAAAQPPADRASPQAAPSALASADAPVRPPARDAGAARDDGTSGPVPPVAPPASRGPNPATPAGRLGQPPRAAAAYSALLPVTPPADAQAPTPHALPGRPQPVIPGRADPAAAPIPAQGEHRDREPTVARPGRRGGAAGSLIPAQVRAQAAMARGPAPTVAAQPSASVPEPPARGDGGALVPTRPAASPVAPKPPPPAVVEASGSRAAPAVPAPVQVRIGTVEVRAAPPPAPAGRPPGFEEYRSMRTYAGWRLDGGRGA